MMEIMGSVKESRAQSMVAYESSQRSEMAAAGAVALRTYPDARVIHMEFYRDLRAWVAVAECKTNIPEVK